MPHGGRVDSVCDLIFADNDILLKLAEYDLLQEACAALSTAPADIRFQLRMKYWIATEKSKLAKGNAASYSAAAFDRALAFAESGGYLSETVNIDWVEGTEDIDFGEAQLATWTIESGDASLLLTGDKRFMKALA